MFKALRQRMARWLAPQRTQSRTYAMGKASRLTAGWGTSTSSEDMELASSLLLARNRSRALIRDAAYAKRAKVIVQNNVVGGGIGLQAKIETTRGNLNERLNDAIETAWERWSCAESCHTGGALHFADLERQLIGQVFEAGEVFVRMHPQRFGDSAVPFALELIEAERIADEFQPLPVSNSARVRLGIEVDAFGRPLAYWIRNTHPGDVRWTAEQTTQIERVPAEYMLHLRVIDRWPQTRAIPWMHAAARKLNDMDGLTEAEITAARGAACYMATIETPDGETGFGEEQADGSTITELEPAIVERLNAGEKLNFVSPNRPNSQLDPFMRMMLREVAAGVGCSYESLSRDYSQSNYSSSRLALMDDRDLWRVLQRWFIRNFRAVVHRRWLQQAVLSGAIREIPLEEYAVRPEKFEAVCFKPRGWSWIDPTKEVEAYEKAIRNGFTTVSAVIAQTADGRDLEDVLKERAQELEMMEAMELVFDTDPSTVKTAAASTPPADPSGSQGPAEDSDPGEADPSVQTAEKLLRTAGRAHA